MIHGDGNEKQIDSDESGREWTKNLKSLAYEQETSELKKKWEAASASLQRKLQQDKQDLLAKGGFKDWDALKVENSRNDPSEFYRSRSWQNLRYEAFKRYGKRCALCGRSPNDGVILHVDHIKPRSKHPELALDIKNLQILCEDCNMGKGAKDKIKWCK
ncbi:MAG: HNH endonuclease [Gallionella sp.]